MRVLLSAAAVATALLATSCSSEAPTTPQSAKTNTYAARNGRTETVTVAFWYGGGAMTSSGTTASLDFLMNNPNIAAALGVESVTITDAVIKAAYVITSGGSSFPTGSYAIYPGNGDDGEMDLSNGDVDVYTAGNNDGEMDLSNGDVQVYGNGDDGEMDLSNGDVQVYGNGDDGEMDLSNGDVQVYGHVDNDGDMDIVYGDVDVYRLAPSGLSGLSQLLISQQPGHFSMNLSEGSATSPARTGLYVVAKLTLR